MISYDIYSKNIKIILPYSKNISELNNTYIKHPYISSVFNLFKNNSLDKFGINTSSYNFTVNSWRLFINDLPPYTPNKALLYNSNLSISNLILQVPSKYIINYLWYNSRTIINDLSTLYNTYSSYINPQIIVSASLSKNQILLGDSYTITYILKNTGELITNSINYSFDDIGLSFISGFYVYNDSNVNIDKTPKNLSLPNLDINESITIKLTYATSDIPTSLIFENKSITLYTFKLDNNLLSSNIEKKALLEVSHSEYIKSINENLVQIIPPVIDYYSPELSYQISTPPQYGSIDINNGILVYTPYSLSQVNDLFGVIITNTTTSKSSNIIYNIDIILEPNLIINYTQYSPEATLGSLVESEYEFINQSSSSIKNIRIAIAISPGYLLSSSEIIDSTGNTFTSNKDQNYFYIDELAKDSKLIIYSKYEAIKIPTDLYYKNIAFISYSFGDAEFYLSKDGSCFDILANLSASTTQNNMYSNLLPIINSYHTCLKYSIYLQGSLGIVNIDENGLLTYMPFEDSLGIDNFIVNISNSQNKKTLYINYTVNISSIMDSPYFEYIYYKLQYLLTNDIYLIGFDKLKTHYHVCFNCNLWDNGYIYNDITIIYPIKNSLSSILDEFIIQLQSIHLSKSVSINTSFNTQINRLLQIVIDFRNKIILIYCNTDCDSKDITSNFFSLLSQSINLLINISSTLNGLLSINDSNEMHFSYLMGIFIEYLTEFYNIMPSWNDLSMLFLQLTHSYSKPYVPTYIPENTSMQSYSFHNFSEYNSNPKL